MSFTKAGYALLTLLMLVISSVSYSQSNSNPEAFAYLDEEVREFMEEGDIPGLSLVIISGDTQVIKTFGYADIEEEKPVTSQTLFQLGSTTKAFTALGLTRLEQQGKIDLDKYVSDYIPWFKVTYKEEPVKVTLRQVMHHTSGIPWKSISKIPATSEDDALEVTVQKLVGQELSNGPGKEFEYATINYDILALIIQEVTGESFETYMQQHVIDELGMTHTTLGQASDTGLMAKGHKVSFFAAREYQAPVYRGNYAAGYIVTNALDMVTWLRFQTGLMENDLSNLLPLTHTRDRSVPLHGMSAYGRGWEVALDGTGEIYHGGMNPNFTSYVAFRPDRNIGVAVLANSNSNVTSFIGNRVIQRISGDEIEPQILPGDNNDGLYTSISLVVLLYIAVVLGYIAYIFRQTAQKKRHFKGLSTSIFIKLFWSLVFVAPFIYGGYILPEAIAGFDWSSIVVWSPDSFLFLMRSLLVAVGVSFLAYFISMLIPDRNPYRQVAPQIILMSMLSGLANVVVIIMVTSGIRAEEDLGYLIFYYGLVLAIYLLGRKFVQVQLIKITRGLIYDTSVQLINKVFSTSYQNFEKIERGRVYATFNDDVNTIGQSTNVILTLITSIITAIGAFVYLASIAAWATVIVVGLILTLGTIYYFVGQKANPYYEQARDSRNVFMDLLSGMVEGFKELSLHRDKKVEYRKDVATSANEYREKISTADIRFVNAFLVGESLLVVLLGFVSFGMHQFFPSLPFSALMSFVVVLLYLIGPINGILNSVPQVMRLKVSWNRVNTFIDEIPANLDLDTLPQAAVSNAVQSLKVDSITFTYKNKSGEKVFSVGPINLEIKSGEILFIIGGNGSGKTTLAKMLTGLYAPDTGKICLNGNAVNNAELGEYYSTVYATPYLFEKLYNIDVEEKREMITKYLKVLDLDHKVSIENGRYNTINLSGGQRKRLALLQCYLEDSPIYLFDEWAADQDPTYRHFFYRTLLPEIKKMGKIVIAITHDDHYFDIADKVVKMDQGQLEMYSGNDLWGTKSVKPISLSAGD